MDIWEIEKITRFLWNKQDTSKVEQLHKRILEQQVLKVKNDHNFSLECSVTKWQNNTV